MPSASLEKRESGATYTSQPMIGLILAFVHQVKLYRTEHVAVVGQGQAGMLNFWPWLSGLLYVLRHPAGSIGSAGGGEQMGMVCFPKLMMVP